MAYAGAGLLSSEEKTNFLRLASLLIDGGTLALKTQFDLKFPPVSLSQDLQSPGNHQLLLQLKKKKILTAAQFELLFPPAGIVADSSKFDVSLLSCLIQSVPAFHQQNSPIWKQRGLPAPTDVTLAADVKRLRCLRNQMFHSSAALMPDNEFQRNWKELADVIQRLCVNTPDIQNLLTRLLQQPIDPAKEKEYLEKLKEWNDFGLKLERLEHQIENVQEEVTEHDIRLKESKDDLIKHKSEIEELKAQNEQHNENIDTCKKGVEMHDVEIENLRDTERQQQERLGALDMTLEEHGSDIAELQKISQKHEDMFACKEDVEEVTRQLSDELEKEKKKIDVIQINLENQGKESTEFRALKSRSKMFFQEKEENEFIETAMYDKAKGIFNRTKVVILQGNPGEGKTTMAKHLLLSKFDSERCLNIEEPSDWTGIDFSLKLVDAVLIDDIFGADILEDRLIQEWERKLPGLLLAAKRNEVSVILTGRDYILEEAKRKLRSDQLFKDENTQKLCSEDLTTKELEQILKSQLKAEKRETHLDIRKCCSSFEKNFQRSSTFGFPECASLFARQKELFERGPEFFAQPKEFFKTFINRLYKNEEKFLALIMIWAHEDQELKRSELDEERMSERIKRIVKKFNFKLKGKLIKQLKQSLEFHKGGLLNLSIYTDTGRYSFNHSVIRDMVGLVVTQEDPACALEFCSREFVMKYITTEPNKDDFKVSVERFLYDNLVKRIAEIMFVEKTGRGYLHGIHMTGRHCGRDKETKAREFDALMLKHDCFQNSVFAPMFLRHLIEKQFLDTILSKKVITISGLFLGYGIDIGRQKLYLLSYAAFVKADALAECMVSSRLFEKTDVSYKAKQMEYFLTLLSAVHHNSTGLVKLLVPKYTYITEEALYIAALGNDMDLLGWLLRHRNTEYIHAKASRIVNENNALIVAAKKGLLASVNCLITCGYGLEACNINGYSALDRAIAYKHEDICEALLNAGAATDMSGGKFQRTPIHTAADVGLLKVTKLLLEKGAKLRVKDRKGFYPIHAAAMNGHLDIVKLFLEHDLTQADTPIQAYGKKSLLKGKTLFHIAIYTRNLNLIQLLLDMKISTEIKDYDGRTPFFNAAASGNSKAVEMLMDVSDVYVRDKYEASALHAAVASGSLEAVKLLGPLIDVNTMDSRKQTPLHVAAKKRLCEVFLYLIEQRADYRMETKYGQTVMDLAMQKEKMSVIRILDNSADMVETKSSTMKEPALKSVSCKTNKRNMGIFERLSLSLKDIQGQNMEKCCKVFLPKRKGDNIEECRKNEHGAILYQREARGYRKNSAHERYAIGPDFFDLVVMQENDDINDQTNVCKLDEMSEDLIQIRHLETQMGQISINDKGAETMPRLSRTLEERYLNLLREQYQNSCGRSETASRIISTFHDPSSLVSYKQQYQGNSAASSCSVYTVQNNVSLRNMRVLLAIVFDLDPVFFSQKLKSKYDICYASWDPFELQVFVNSKDNPGSVSDCMKIMCEKGQAVRF